MRSADKTGRHSRRKPRLASQRERGREPSQERGREIEVKLRVADRQALLTRLAARGAVFQGRVHEMNTLYDTRDRSLMRKGQLLRIRIERLANHSGKDAPDLRRQIAGALLTFKGRVRRRVSAAHAGGRYKVREELEVRSADGDALAVILEALGFRPSFRYEKYRSTYRLPSVRNVILELDETPVGDFLEAEGTREAIDRAAERLGYRPADYVTKSYWHLFQESMRKSGHTSSPKRQRFSGVRGRDMLFRSKK